MANKVFVSGKISAEVIYANDPEMNQPVVKTTVTSESTYKGKIISSTFFCKFIGEGALATKELKPGDKVFLEGKLKHNKKVSYIESDTVGTL